MADRPSKGAPKGTSKSKPAPKLVWTSESSSSSDIPSTRHDMPKKTLPSEKAPGKRGGPPPPPPSIDALGSLHVPASPRRPRTKQPWESDDPLLSVDPPPASMQRIKSAVLVGAENSKLHKARPQGAAASMELPQSKYQVLRRGASKAERPFVPPKAETPASAQAPAQREVLKSKGSPSPPPPPLPRQKTNPPRLPAAPEAGSRALGTAGLQGKEIGVKHVGPKPPVFSSEGSSSQNSPAGGGQRRPQDDAWMSTPQNSKQPNKARDLSPRLGLESSKDLGSGEMIDRRTSLAEKVAADAKQIGKTPKSPRKPKGLNDEISAYSRLVSNRSGDLLLSPREQKSKSPRAANASDTAMATELQRNFAASQKRVTELEEKLRDVLQRYKDELVNEKQKMKIECDEAVEKARREADEKIQSCQKNELQKLDELKKEALARQNSIKMHCASSVKGLQEKVDFLEKQLKSKTEEFENEKKALTNSFEEKRKIEVKAHERELLAHQKELKSKDSELLETQGRVQALTTSVQTLTTSLSQMKELNDISRTATQALEEKSKTQAAFITTLMKREENMRTQAAKLMPIKEAKRLAFRALLKGRAVEMIARACVSTDSNLWDKAWAFQQFVYLIGGSRGSKDKRQDAIEARLMQFRKEQMFLMAENERLMAKVAQLQQDGVNQRQSKAALVEQALIAENSGITRNITQSPENQGPQIRWLVSAIQCTINKKLLWVFMRLQKVTTEAQSSTTVDKLQRKFNELRVSAYKEMAARIGVYKITAYIRVKYKVRCVDSGLSGSAYCSVDFSALARTQVSPHPAPSCNHSSTGQLPYYNKHSHLQGPRLQQSVVCSKKGRRSKEEAIKNPVGQPVSRDPFSKDSMLLEAPTPENYGMPLHGMPLHGMPLHGMPLHQQVDLNAPLAHQPYYYRQLPSVRNPCRNRNIFLPMVEPGPPLRGYLPHLGYSNQHLSLGVSPAVPRGRRTGSNTAIPNVFPSGPYDATQPVDERGAIFCMRGTQQELRRTMNEDMSNKGSTLIVGKKLPNTSFQ